MTIVGNINGSESANLYFLLMQQISKPENSTSGLSGLLKGAGTQGVTGLDGNGQGLDALRTKIDDAVAGALKKLDKSSSATEIMQTIKTTVDSTLKANGIDPKAMQESMSSHMKSGGADDARLQMQGDAGGKFMAMIEQLLQENGFDVDKFKNELKSAISSSSSPLDLFGSIHSKQGVNVEA
jgi:translation initiation factor 1 (eIF-1/SUI1)